MSDVSYTLQLPEARLESIDRDADAITLHFSRLARTDATMAPLLAVGTLIACGTMFPRVLFIAALLNPALFRMALPVTALMAFIIYFSALVLWHSAISAYWLFHSRPALPTSTPSRCRYRA